MPKQGRSRKKKRTAKEVAPSEKELKKTPRCFVLKRGLVSNLTRDLVKDFREVMSPNCAKSLRESRINRLEDFAAVAGHLHVSHLIIFTATKAATYMKLAKLPQGPTLTFRIESFSLSHEVRAAQKRPRQSTRDYASAPLQVLNGFTGKPSAVERPTPRELVSEMLRGLFPAVDVPSFNQAEVRRTALFSYDPETDLVHFRHYHVTQSQGGLERGVSKLLRTSRLPKLGRKDDIADFILGGGGGASESENEQPVEAPDLGGGKIAVRLTETGPRLALQLIKAAEGVCNGGVLYHRYLTKTPSQQQVLEERARQRRKLKERNAKLEKKLADAKKKPRRKNKDKEKDEDRDDGGGDGEDEPLAKRSRWEDED